MHNNKGWIKLNRKLQNHWLWNDKPFDKRSAWIDMLMMANHSDNKFLLGNQLVEVKEGSFITSELKLMDRWGWSKTKVRSFIKLLEDDNMIVKKSDNKKTTLTIVNYSVYQDSQTTEEPQKNHEQTTEEPQKDTNKNEKNDNNEKENIYKSLYDYYMQLDLIKHKEYTKSMENAIKKAMNENKYTIERCKELLKRHEIKVKETMNSEHPVTKRGIGVFFGQKIYNSTNLICTQYDIGGCYYNMAVENIEKKKTNANIEQTINVDDLVNKLRGEVNA